jgi:hypothetical protein
MAGVNLARVQQYLGHTTISMTMRYSHLAPENGQADIERMVPTAAAPARRVKPPARAAKPAAKAKIVKIA